MTRNIWFGGFFLLAALLPVTAVAQQPVLININGKGDKAKFIRDGDTEPKPVEVKVGETVRWKNNDDVAQHSIVSDKVNGKIVFESANPQFLKHGDQVDILFDEKLYQAAGGKTGQSVEIKYICGVHPNMQSSIIVKSAGGPVPMPMEPSGRVHVVEAISDDSGHRFRPDTVYGVKPGDEVVFRNADVMNPGQHSLGFKNWAGVRGSIDIISQELAFDRNLGKTPDGTASSDRKIVFLKVKVKELPATGIEFFCPVHLGSMSGKLVSTEAPKDAVVASGTGVVNRPTLTTPTGLIAAFDAVKVTDRRADSYYAVAADINGDGKPDLIVSGLGESGKTLSEVAWFENPTWQKHVIGKFEVPVAMTPADVDGDGLIDLAICYEYGFCIRNCKPENGTVAWLKNPGKTDTERDWQTFHIGKHMASHRLKFGHFTQTKELELLSVPVVGGTDGKIHDPITIKVFTRPKDVLKATDWKWEVASDSLRVIHEIEVRKFGVASGSKLDSFLTASEEGISWVKYGTDKKWSTQLLGAGETKQVNLSPDRWKGSGSVDAGKIGKDSLAYIAATEPFHGNLLAIYTKDAENSLDRLRWKRRVIDTLGPLTVQGEGPGHHVKTIDLDGDGDDELLVGLRGPTPHSGVYAFKVKDLAQGKFIRQQVSTYSAAEIIVADFDGDGVPDFATIPYRVINYFVADNTEVMVFLNRTPQVKKKAARPHGQEK